MRLLINTRMTVRFKLCVLSLVFLKSMYYQSFNKNETFKTKFVGKREFDSLELLALCTLFNHHFEHESLAIQFLNCNTPQNGLVKC
ncbi:MAG: hypothetical protein ACFWT6_18420 [Virgibacillus proomii]|jgi:hypothetical protein